MERVQKRKNEEAGGGEAKKRKKEKDFIRGKLGGPYEQYCMLFLKHRAQEEKFSKWKIEASNFMFWRYFDQPQRDIEFDLWGETKVSRVPELDFRKQYVY